MKVSYARLALGKRYLPLTFVLALPLGGCFIVTDPEPDRVLVSEPTNPASALTVRWTIGGSTNPAQCQQSLTPTIEIRLFDTSGRQMSSYQAACTSFATSITLDPGSYSARAQLLGESQQPRSTAVDIALFTLRGGDELITDVDFPSDSFL